VISKSTWIIARKNLNIFNLLLDLKFCCFQNHALINRIENATSEEERRQLQVISSKNQLAATLLPIRSVGVQVRN
jgi:GMP synthase (glutamine-hydrolysing)